MVRIYTVGHSNRTLPELVAILLGGGIEALVDVRAHPGSRRNPQFNQAPLRAALAQAGIDYRWAGEHLGGMRKATANSPHRALASNIRGYAEHMHSDAFRDAVEELQQLADRAQACIMCAERDPASCHRSLIADHLLCAGDSVTHLLGAASRTEHRLHPAARLTDAGLVYDRRTQASLDLR